MKTKVFTPARRFVIAASTLGFIVQAQAATNFFDDFTSGASANWGNEKGAWSAEGGVYRAAEPGNIPAAVSFLPFSLTDFSVDFDINDVSDGGICLRCSPVPGTAVGIRGIFLNLKTFDGPPRIYWHIAIGGTDFGVLTNMIELEYGNNPHIHIEVSGNTYSAFVNGSSNAATTLTTSAFASGRVALYDNSGQSFDNFALQAAETHSGGTITSVAFPATEVRWHSQLGAQYQVQWAPPMPWNPPAPRTPPHARPWTNVGAPQPGTGTIMSFFDTQRRPIGGSYRVQLL